MTTAIPTLRTTSRGSIIPLVDYLLGFRPSSSTALVFLRGSTVLLAARIDNEDLSLPEIGAQMLTAVERVKADHVFVVSYDALDAHVRATHALVAPLVEAGVAWEDHILVSERFWYSTATGEQGPLADLASDPIECHRILAGKSRAASREELAGQIEPGRDEPSEAFQQGYAAMQEAMRQMSRDDIVRAIGVLLDQENHDDQELGEIAALCLDFGATEPALARIRCESADRWLDLWSRLVRLTKGESAVLPIIAAGCAAWASGQGVLVTTAIETLAELDAEHPIGRVLNHAQTEVLPPALWDDFAMRLEPNAPGVPG